VAKKTKEQILADAREAKRLLADEALTGLIYAGLSLEGMDKHVGSAVRALAKDCVAQVDSQGGIPTRNPEELLEVFTLLTWASAALTEAGILNSVTGGTLLCRTVFAAVNKGANDTLQITWTVSIAAS